MSALALASIDAPDSVTSAHGEIDRIAPGNGSPRTRSLSANAMAR
nr:hypothetical protein [Mycolicibacterium mengxianglii]